MPRAAARRDGRHGAGVARAPDARGTPAAHRPSPRFPVVAVHSALIPLVVSLAMLPAALAAQQAADTARTADSARVQLPAVTVVGARYARPSVAVPLAVTVVPRARLRDVRGVGLDEGLALVPGVLAQSRSGGSDVRLVIRGFGARGAGDRSNSGTSRGVRVLLDGIPETEPDGRTAFDNVDLAVAEGLEIVRSNASALWGNAAGGVVSLTTMPATREPFAELTPMAGSDGLRRWVLRVGAPLGPGSGWASAAHTRIDGWRERSDARRTTLNAGVHAPLSDQTRLGVHLSAADNDFRIPGPLTRAQLEADPRQSNATYAARDERRMNRVARIGATVEHELGSGTTLSAMAFASPKALERSERGTYRDFARYHVGGSVMARDEHPIAGNVRGTLQVGADHALQDGAIQFYELSSTNGRGTTLTDNRREGAMNLGVFVQEELAVGRRWAFTLGARWDQIRYDYADRVEPQLDDERAYTRVTPKVGVVWRPSLTHAFYANAGGGVEAPAGNETSPAGTFGQDTITGINPLLDPIISTTWEVGTKQTLGLGGGALQALAYDVALYSTDVRNEMVPYRGGRFYFSAGRVRRRGAELGLGLSAAGGVDLQMSLTASDNRYRSYVVDSAHYGVPGASTSYAGNQAVGVPRLFGAATVGWAPAFASPARISITARGVGRYYADDANTVRVPGYGTVDATLSMHRAMPVMAALGVRGFVSVTNLTDRRYVGSSYLNPDVVGGQPVAFEPGMPRQVVVGLQLDTGR